MCIYVSKQTYIKVNVFYTNTIFLAWTEICTRSNIYISDSRHIIHTMLISGKKTRFRMSWDRHKSKGFVIFPCHIDLSDIKLNVIQKKKNKVIVFQLKFLTSL